MTTDDTNNDRESGCLIPFAGSNNDTASRHESNLRSHCTQKTMTMLWILLLVPHALVVPRASAAFTLTPPPTWTARNLAGSCHPSSFSSFEVRYLRFSISSCAITSTRSRPRISSIDFIDNNDGTRLHLSKSKAADSNENGNQEDEEGRNNFAENVVEGAGGIASRVGRLGSRVVGNVLKKGKEDVDDDNDNDNDDNDDGKKQGDRMSSTKNLFRRFVKSKPDGIIDNERGEDDTASKGNQDKNIFGFENALDSEVALVAALKRQNELQNDRTISASEKIVESTPSESGFIKAIASVEESLSSIRNQLSSVRFNEDDESNELLLTRKQEEKRLNQIRRDLENRRKQLILDEQKKKKEMAAQLAEKKRQQRIAAEAAKREREAKMEEERKRKEKSERQKQIFDNATKGGGIGPGNIGKSILAKEEKAPKSEEKNPLKRAGISGIDGLFTGAQSAISNAWDSVFKNDGKDDGEWIPVCPKTRISPGEIVPVVAGGVDLLIVASPDGKKVHCIANSCAHLGTPLETGRLERRPIETSRSAAEPNNNLDTRGLAASSKAASNKGDGCEVCIVCPLHETAFALESGEVRGEWCPYPPVIGKMMGAAKPESKLPTFAIRTNGKNIEVRMSSSLETPDESKRKRRGQ